jgi:hypothetical protein
LREACQTGVDGTSIDSLKKVAVQLGLAAEQIMVPVESAGTKPLSPELTAALAEPPARPLWALLRFLQEDGLLAPLLPGVRSRSFTRRPAGGCGRTRSRHRYRFSGPREPAPRAGRSAPTDFRIDRHRSSLNRHVLGLDSLLPTPLPAAPVDRRPAPQ